MNIRFKILIIITFLFIFLLFFLKNSDKKNDIKIYQLKSKLQKCKSILDNKIKQYKRYKILSNKII